MTILPDTTTTAIIRWADDNDHVRATLLTSTRARPNATLDRWSDYDILLVVREIEPLLEDRSWIDTFGDVIVAYWDPLEIQDDGLPWSGNVIQYAGDLKIDTVLWPVERLARMTGLDSELDAGYTVLLDKDGLTTSLPPPTYRAYLPQRPDPARFAQVVNDFYVGVPYVAKCLLRDETMPGRWVLDYDMRFVYLQPMLEWRAAVETGWTVPTGVNGKGLQTMLPADFWRTYEATYASAGHDAVWNALFAMCEVFRTCGEAVAAALGHTFDTELHDRVMAHAAWMRTQAT